METSIKVEKIDKIYIHVPGEGSFLPNYYWIVEANGQVIKFPQNCVGAIEVEKIFLKIPGADLRTIISSALAYELFDKEEKSLFYDRNNLINPSEYDGSKKPH